MNNPSIQFNFLEAISLTERTRLKRFLIALFKRERKALADLQYIFCSDPYLLEINRQFLHHDFYTDIITFDLSEKGRPTSGEIYISVDRVRDNARNFDSTLKKELHRVIFHGALHLCGFKDKTPKEELEMRKTEEKYLALYERFT
ncbi:MAG TPA: rRNA maturation RNase YbeY [Puia sp.]|uniref:rRNA maturation RNase YbeY n=1 Tax=Puia sp. TaxID=2045100 RepID=UPI002C3A2B5D|nr:rRNA maturation RNase YbeY [Puia sp.]HVU97210.1 rRNA maturation RNase YbeY [Puia sp.]